MRRDLGTPGLRMEIRNGPAAPCIVAAAAEQNAALIVVGCRGVGALNAAVLGAVTDTLIRSAPCPVVVVPPAVAETGAAPLSGDCVLCGVQRSEDVECARVAHRLRLRRGHAGRKLAELAVAEDAMLVVVGSRRWRGPLTAALLGSVSRRLACAGRRPLVLCPGPPSSA